MSLRETQILKLQETLQETLSYFGQPADAMNRSYGPGKWTMRQILVHISDTETVLLDRLRRLVAEEKPLLLVFDENRWAEHLFYTRRELDLVRVQFATARLSVIELAMFVPDEVDARAGQHSTAGPQTFAQVLEKVAKHTAHHLDQVKAIAEGKQWP